MTHPVKRLMRKAVAIPFVAGLALGVAGTGAGAAMLGSSIFPDVQPGSYYDVAVGELNAAGIIKGSNGKFMPEKPVTRAEVATMLYRLRAEMLGEDIVEPGDSGSTTSRAPRSKSSKSTAVSSSSSSSVASSLAYNPKGMFRFTTANYTVGEQLGKVTITVVRTGGNEGTVTINYATVAGTAGSSDFTSASGSVTLSNKETSKSFVINVNDDSTSEGDEKFTIVLSNPGNGVSLGSPSTTTVTILDNETGGGTTVSNGGSNSSSPAAGTFNFQAVGYAVNENSTVTVTVQRTGGSQGTADVTYATSNGTGTAGSEFNGTSGTLSFAAGETTKTFTLTALNNSAMGNKTFNVTLSNPTNGSVLGDSKQALVTIYDDETQTFGSGSLKFSKANYDVLQSAGRVNVTLQRTGGAAGTISVNYTTFSGTASASDYTFTSGTLTFAPGEAAKIITIPILKNSNSTGEKTFSVELSNQTSGIQLVTPYSANVTIYK